MEVYLDNAATTKMTESVRNLMMEVMEENYGNPSSMHTKGMAAERYLINAGEIIASALKVETKELIFTSGGTESNNIALFGAARANKRAGKHIITTVFEHPSVLNPLIALEQEGFFISFIPVDRSGKIKLERLLDMITEETILISLIHVNNEIGAVQDIVEIAKAIKQKKQDVLLHVDAIQSFGKYMIYPKRMLVDLMSISGHKLHGPKGSGVLYVRDKVKLSPILLGGGQQRGLRSGTENVPAIAGLGQAVFEYDRNRKARVEHLYQCKQYFLQEITQIEGVILHAVGEGAKEVLGQNILHTAPHIASVGFLGIRSEVMLHSLEEHGIYVSAGSACASNHPAVSSSLQAIGVRKDCLDSTIRFSFSIDTSIEEISYTLEVLRTLIPKLVKFRRK